MSKNIQWPLFILGLALPVAAGASELLWRCHPSDPTQAWFHVAVTADIGFPEVDYHMQVSSLDEEGTHELVSLKQVDAEQDPDETRYVGQEGDVEAELRIVPGDFPGSVRGAAQPAQFQLRTNGRLPARSDLICDQVRSLN
jgi:hypothetical protein